MKLFEEIRSELIEKVQLLSRKHHLSLYHKIIKEQDRVNLKSLMTEAHFCFYYDTFSTSIKYNKKIFSGTKNTPDFVVSANGQDIVMEVCRVNPARVDAEIQEAEVAAITEFQNNNPGVPIIGSTHMITRRPEKLIGKNGSILEKAEKYGPLVEKAKLPIIICIYLDLISGHNALDLYHVLYGSSAELWGDFPIDGYYPHAPFHHFGDALYYGNEQMRKNISGVLLRSDGDEFVYYHNFSSENRLSAINQNYFSLIQHTYR